MQKNYLVAWGNEGLLLVLLVYSSKEMPVTEQIFDTASDAANANVEYFTEL